jgi:hypothetical protein
MRIITKAWRRIATALTAGAALSALLVAASLLLSGCLSVNEALTGRDLRCQDTPELDCLRIIDHTLATHEGDVNDLDAGPIVDILVSPMDCQFVADATATRCWEVEISQERGSVSAHVHERADGSLTH